MTASSRPSRSPTASRRTRLVDRRRPRTERSGSARRTASALYAHGQWQQLHDAKDGLPSNDVTCLTEDRRRPGWRGSGRRSGCAFVIGGRVGVPANAPAVLRGADCWAWPPTTRGSLWIATSNRVLRRRLATSSCAASSPDDRARCYGVRRRTRAASKACRRHQIGRRRSRAAASGSRSAAGSRCSIHVRRRPASTPAIAHSRASRPTASPIESARWRADPAGPQRLDVSLRRPESGRARARPVPLPARRLRRRLERAGHHARGDLHEPRSRTVPLSRHGVEQRGRVERRRGGASPSRSRRTSGRRPGSSSAAWSRSCSDPPASIASACSRWRASSTCGSKSGSPSARASPRICTTRCCRASSARRCSCTSPPIVCRTIAGAGRRSIACSS